MFIFSVQLEENGANEKKHQKQRKIIMFYFNRTTD